jgi:hypothetical protein
MQFLITNDTPGQVLVRWDQPLGRPRGTNYQILAEELEELMGVNRIEMERYRCTLFVDEDIAMLRQVAQEVEETLLDETIRSMVDRMGLSYEVVRV